MKSILHILLVLLPYFLFGQCEKQLVELSNGYLKYYVGNNGEIKTFLLGQDVNKTAAVTDIPDSILFSNGFVKALWFMGLERDSITNLSIRSINRDSDFISGILDSLGEPIYDDCDVFGKIWNVYGEEVSVIRNRFADGLLTVSDIPIDILTWPAKGNPYLQDSSGSVLVDRTLAPFVDYDEDGIYDPLLGDYPIPLKEHKGFLPSQFTFHVYHDVASEQFTDEPPLHVEIAQIVYVVNCEEYGDLKQSIFHRMEVTYKGDKDLEKMKIALHDDARIGNFGADYGGVHLATNSTFVYGDGDAGFAYFVNIPDYYTAYQSTIFLNDSLDFSAPFDSYESISLPRFSTRAKHTFFGRSYNGEYAIDALTGDTSSFWNNYDPSIMAWEWEGNGPLNYEAVAVTDHHDVSNGQTILIDFIETTQIEYAISPAKDILIVYEFQINEVKRQHKAMVEGTTCTKIPALAECQENCVWPGDVNNDSVVTLEDYLLVKSAESKENVEKEGLARQRESSRWHPFTSDDWENSIDGINGKYLDVDGNGSVGQYDAQRASENFQKVHDGGVYPHVAASFDSLGLSIVVNAIGRDSANYYNEGFSIGSLDLRLHIGYGVNAKPIKEICFDLKVDTNNVIHTEPNSADLLTFEKIVSSYPHDYYKQEHYCFSSANGDYLNGQLLRRYFNLMQPATPDTGYVNFLIENIFALDTAGNFIDVGVRGAPPLKDLRSLVTSTSESSKTTIYIYPNPASTNIVVSADDPIKSITIRDIQGAIVLQNFDHKSTTQLSIENLPKGVYLVEVVTKTGTDTEKLVKL